MYNEKKVLHILNTSSYSGAENVVITIINNMSGNYECAYVSMDGPIRNVLEKNNITFLPISKMSIHEIRRIVKLFKPDIIHAHDYTTSIICAVSCVKTKIISHLHNNSPWIKKYHIYSFAYILSCIRYKKVLAVSTSIFDEYVFAECLKGKSMVVSNPIDIFTIKEKAKYVQKDIVSEYDIIFLGRLSEAKDPLRFISIIEKLSKSIPNIKVGMIGDGSLVNACRDKIINTGLEKNIDMLGFKQNPFPILNNAKLLIMTSKWEGYGLVAVEAMALGKPVLATPVGGLKNIVNDLCGGLCISNEDFIYRAEMLLSDKSYYRYLSDNATEKADKLGNIKKYTKSLSTIYDGLLYK